MLLPYRITQLKCIKHIAHNTHNTTVANHDKIHRRGLLSLFSKMALQFGLSHQQRGYVGVFGIQGSWLPFIVGDNRINLAL